ncbi:MAG: amidohydrolase family protein, partial [Pseudomonadota bacterium]
MTTLVLHNGRITTQGPRQPEVEAIAMRDGNVLAIGDERDVMIEAGDDVKRVDLGGRRVIPGLNDSHTHLIRGGLSFNQELRWEGVPSLADALALLKQQADR